MVPVEWQLDTGRFRRSVWRFTHTYADADANSNADANTHSYADTDSYANTDSRRRVAEQHACSAGNSNHGQRRSCLDSDCKRCDFA